MNSRGFTLLEVLIAMALLAVALLALMKAQDNSVLVSEYEEQQITAATLSRYKMTDIELELDKKGFGDDEKENCGKFAEDLDDKEFSDYEWCWTLKKVDLPLPMDMLGGKKDGDDGSGSGSSSSGAPGMPPGLDPKAAGEQLSKAVRVLKLTIKWKIGATPQELSVVTHLVNFSQAEIP